MDLLLGRRGTCLMIPLSLALGGCAGDPAVVGPPDDSSGAHAYVRGVVLDREGAPVVGAVVHPQIFFTSGCDDPNPNAFTPGTWTTSAQGAFSRHFAIYLVPKGLACFRVTVDPPAGSGLSGLQAEGEVEFRDLDPDMDLEPDTLTFTLVLEDV